MLPKAGIERGFYAIHPGREPYVALNGTPVVPITPAMSTTPVPIMRPTILLIALLSAGTAGAAPWSSVARNAESVVEIDTGSLSRKGQTVKAWSRQVYNDDQDLPLGDPPFRAVRYLYSYECGKRSALLVRRTYVDEQGEAIKDQMLDGLEMAKDVIPGTLQERVYDFACKNAKDPEKVAQKAVQVAKADTAPAKEEDAEEADDAEDGKDAAEANTPAKAAGGDKAAKGDKAEKGEKGGEKGEKGPKGHAAKAPGKAAKAAHGDEEADAETHESRSAKPAKQARKAKPAKDEEADAQGGDDEEASAKSPRKAAALDKKSKHDLDGDCDNCEKGEPAANEDKAAKPPAHTVHWAYEGKEGPQNWARLSPEFAACGSGKYQSPIDIREGIRLNLEPIKFDYKPSPLRILDNGHTVQVNYGLGSSITVNGEKYSLVQFHFHKPSEERIEGKQFDMVVHLVHKNMMGQLAVVAVMLRNGAPNPLVQTLWTHLPLQSGKEGMPKNVSIDASQLLPPDRAYYTFLGSLTTPPCSEGVLWLVMKTPMQVSRTQIAAFGRLYESNARPVQQANRRLIKESL